MAQHPRFKKTVEFKSKGLTVHVLKVLVNSLNTEVDLSIVYVLGNTESGYMDHAPSGLGEMTSDFLLQRKLRG